MTPPAAGSLVFAQSADRKFYVAEVLSTSPEVVEVKFLRGGEHSVTLDQLRPCAFVPGQKVTVNWPWWGPWTCTVISYDARGQWVKVTDGWSEERIFPIAEVWLNPKRNWDVASSMRTRIAIKLLGAGVGIGAVAGAALTWLLRG